MTLLFKIDTDLVSLNWSLIQKKDNQKKRISNSQYGLLKIVSRRKDIVFSPPIYRINLSDKLSKDADITIGPILYEQTNYKLFVQSKNRQKVTVTHYDPVIQSMIDYENDHQIALGFINFGSQVGRTKFSISVNNHPEFDFEIEIYPSKLDYVNDYQQLLADIQDVFRGLAFEYLRSTYLQGGKVRVPQPTDLEWLILLQSVVSDLEKAFLHISQHPIRNLIRENQITPIERIRKIDSTIRSEVRRRSGYGELKISKTGIPLKSRINAIKANTTLDTPEHRWLSMQLNSIRQKSSRIKEQIISKYQQIEDITPREKQIVRELDSINKRLIHLNKLEPFDNAKGLPPTGFASIQLLSAPGYREAFQACSILALGLRIEGGPLHLSVKDLNLLYEYWCYIALLKIVSETLQQPIPSSELLKIQHRGLQILLQKGRQCNVRFKTETNRIITLTYNPKFGGENYLVPQQPDILMTMEDPAWPKLQLLFDAKYRVNSEDQYKQQYGSVGPPEDALNVLHRYRDAILEKDGIKSESKQSKRTIVQAAVLFPSHDSKDTPFIESKLIKSLDTIGVGAIPLLPGETKYLEQWLMKILHQGGWDLAERVLPHIAADQLMNWRNAAAEVVLIAPLRPENEQEHLNWVVNNQIYYLPLLKHQRRQYFSKYVAIYSSASEKSPGGIKYFAQVKSLEIMERIKIKTPWNSTRKEEQVIVYRLEKISELEKPILNLNEKGKGQRLSSHRWTSKLGFDRANVLTELFLETEPEWRLYENLKANNIEFSLLPGAVKIIDPEDPKGRTKFLFENGINVRYGGSAGFVINLPSGKEITHSSVKDVIKEISLSIIQG